jgi:Helix-turn-helix domain
MRDKDILEFEQWLTPTEAARIIGISRQATIKRLQAGKLRGAKTHQGWLVDPEDLNPKNR